MYQRRCGPSLLLLLSLMLGIGWFCSASTSETDRVNPVDLEWKDVSCAVGKKQIIQDVSGKASAGKLLAVMGPSGSGKTTLLNALANQIPYSKKTRLYGTVTVAGAKRKAGQDQAYVKQDDVFYSQLTVRETLVMAARLRLPRDVPLDEKVAKVDELINKLGLSKVADTIVGDAKTRGISGGEKKRLSIACQLFGTPSLIFCDEPTTGLDSFQAERVMSTLQQLAKEGHTVICSIHQPRSSIFRMFDDLMVLSEGRVMYHGPASRVAGHFESNGYPMPADTNPAEFAIDIVSIDYTSKEAEEESRERIARLVDGQASSVPVQTRDSALTAGLSSGGASRGRGGGDGVGTRTSVGGGWKEDISLVRSWRNRWLGGNEALTRVHAGKESAQGMGGALVVKPRIRRRAGLVEQFRLLLSRSWRQVNRAKFANMTRVVANLGSAVIFGSIFWKLGMGQTHINDRIGLVQTAVIQCAMSTVAKTLVTFPTESTVVKAERSLKMYSILPYFLSKMIAELPLSALFPNIFGVILYQMTGLHPKRERMLKFLGVLTIEAFAASAMGMLIGCLAKDGDAAMAIGPPLMTVFILFSGFYIAQDNVPRVLRWVKDASMIKHAFEGLCVNELKGLEFECDTMSRGPCIRTGEQMLARVAFDKSTVKGATLGLGKILGSCWVLTYITLALSNPRFQPMIDPTFEAPSADTAAAAAAKTVAGGSRGNHPGTVDDTTALSTCGDIRFGNRGCESPQASRTDRDSGVGFWRHSRHGLGWPSYRVKSTDAGGVEGEVSPNSVAKRRGRDAICVPLVRGGTGRSNWL
ncbi:unnamed protein product [Ascophyllum nodosum]